MSVSDEDAVNPVWMGESKVDPYPFEETHDLRAGPDLHPALLGLLPFVGVWRGRGQGGYPTIENDFAYAQGFNQIQAAATEYGWDLDLG